MTNNSSYFGVCAKTVNLLAIALAALTFGSTIAQGSVIVSVQSVTAAAGTSGDAFDVLLTNSGPSSINVGAFSFGISTTNSIINFTDANTSTAVPYVLASGSLFGPDLTGPVSGQSLTTSDVASQPFGGSTLASGATVGLGHVLFNVADNAAPGQYAVNLIRFATTSLSDPSGNNINIDTLSGGQITIPAVTSVPEPSSLLLLLAVAPMALASRKFGRRSNPAA